MNLYVILGLVVLLGVVAYFVRKSGSDAAQLSQEKANVKAAEAVAVAVAESPTNQQQLIDELQHGGKL